MTKNFTSPEFAKVLNKHGIEIDTQFFWFNDKVELQLRALSIENSWNVVIATAPYNNSEWVSLPAYPLTEVLGWLPKRITITNEDYSNSYCVLTNYMFYKFQYKCQYGTIVSGTAEALITEGLTEGWLTKETILQVIKDNAK